VNVLRFVLITAALLGHITASAAAVTYKATLLHPTGFLESIAYGVSEQSQVGYGNVVPNGFVPHALLWSGSSNSFVDLNPPTFSFTEAHDSDGDSQVGFGLATPFQKRHAVLWHGTPESAVDLHPAGFDTSRALGVSGSIQVGWGSKMNVEDDSSALLWHGSAESAVDLTPHGFSFSRAEGVSGSSQVGWGKGPATSGQYHALLWNGNSDSAIDLHPVDRGFFQSLAYDVSEGSQVGSGSTGLRYHALLWHGTAASALSLNPAGFNCIALGVGGAQQAGACSGPGLAEAGHAILWSGTAESYVDLHPFVVGLVPSLIGSVAQDIDPHGNVVGFILDDRRHQYAVLWTPIPEPSSCSLVASALVVILSCRCRLT
jgi:hypothetical protein